MADIFLSYSRDDRPKAEIIAKALEAAGYSVWWDKVLRAGQTYDEVTEDMLSDSKVAVVLWSKTSVNSKWVRAEATLGQRRCALVPAMIEEAERPIMFELVQSADLIGWEGDIEEPRWRQFVADIQLGIAKQTPPEPEPEPEEVEQPQKKKGKLGLLISIIMLSLLGGGAYMAWNGHFDHLADSFSDCDVCPKMVRLEPGVFNMGSPDDEPGRTGTEGPRHLVQIPAFAVAETEVTFAEWDACVADGGCGGYSPPDQGFGRGDQPVIGVSWNDTQAYVQWLSLRAGRTYRLPSEAEWEYAARANTMTAYWWGVEFNTEIVPLDAPRAVSDLQANPFGLKGLLGNAREWVEDCYVNSYLDAPTDGRAQVDGDCSRRVLRGGAWSRNAEDHRAANRARTDADTRDNVFGFRVATNGPSR